MNSFEAIGQAHLETAEGHRQMSHALVRWVGQVVRRWLGGPMRSRAESRTVPW